MRDLRQLRGISQSEVARRVPCARSYISKYENGFIVPALQTLGKLAPVLGIGLGELLDESIAVEQLAMEGGGWIAQMLGYLSRLDATSRYTIVQTARGLMRGHS